MDSCEPGGGVQTAAWLLKKQLKLPPTFPMFFRLAVTALSALSLAASLHAEDTGKPAYTATVSGVTCSACKAHVETALRKLPGVETVTFEKGDKEETVKASFKSTSATLAKDDVVTALGKDAETYTVVALDKAK